MPKSLRYGEFLSRLRDFGVVSYLHAAREARDTWSGQQFPELQRGHPILFDATEMAIP